MTKWNWEFPLQLLEGTAREMPTNVKQCPKSGSDGDGLLNTFTDSLSNFEKTTYKFWPTLIQISI